VTTERVVTNNRMFPRPTLKRSPSVGYAPKRAAKRTKSLQPRTYVKKGANTTELKTVHNETLPGVPNSQAGGIVTYGTIAAGDDFNQRTGRLVRHVDQTLTMRFDLSGNYDNVCVRIIHGIWKQPNVAPSVGMILDQNVGPIAFMLPYNVQTSRNYRILSDENFTLQNTGAYSSTPPFVPSLQVYKRKLKYAAIQEYAGPNDTDVVDWMFFVLLASTTSDGSTQIVHTCNFTDN